MVELGKHHFDERRECCEQAGGQDGLDVHEPGGPVDVSGDSLGAGGVDPGLVDDALSVAGGAAEADSEGACVGGFGMAGVGALVREAPAEERAERGSCAAPDERRGGARDEGRDTGREPVGHVVGPGGYEAEVQVAFVSVAEHGVHGVDGAVGKGTPRPEERAPEQWRGGAIN